MKSSFPTSAILVVVSLLAVGGRAQTSVRGWGVGVVDSAWSEATGYVEIAAGGRHAIARRSDGSVLAWGDNGYGQCDVPAFPPGVCCAAIAAGLDHTIARLTDGSVVAWGGNGSGQCNVPALAAGSSYVEIAGGAGHTVARVCPTGSCSPLSLVIAQNTTTSCGSISISVAGATPWNELYNLVSLSCTNGTGPLLGLSLDVWPQILLPLGSHPFHVQADALGGYYLNIAAGCTTSISIEAVTIEVMFGTGVIHGVSPTTGCVNLML